MTSIRFCKKCENMLYIELSEETPDQFSYYCRKCGNKEKHNSDHEFCISKINISNSEEKQFSLNQYTKNDPLLPTINIPCPNVECGHNEATYIRYDEDNMSYLYLCKKCNMSWKTKN